MTREQDTAKKMVEVLNYGASELDKGTTEKLAAARQQALKAMAQRAYVSHAETSIAGIGRYIVEHMHGPRAWMPMALILAAALLLFIVAQQNSSTEPVEADALLLASDLPPEAYVDKGFDAWLQNSSRH